MAVSAKQVVVQFQFVELIIWAGAYDASAFFGEGEKKMATYYSEQQIEKARSIDLLTYASASPTDKQTGPRLRTVLFAERCL